MGTCFSKKNTASPSPPSTLQHPPAQIQIKPDPVKKKADEESSKKEVFIIKHRRSHDIDRRYNEENPKRNDTQMGLAFGASVTTSSCSKEDVDEILMECGRLSRSSTRKETVSRSLGSKKSFDFDQENVDNVSNDNDIVDEEAIVDSIQRQRQQLRGSRSASTSPQRRRRTPSRERAGGRRVSRSPGRRFESPSTSSLSGNGGGCGGSSSNGRPGKMVAVPATVNSLVSDRGCNGGGGVVELPMVDSIRRVQMKRSAGVSRNQRQQEKSLFLSRSNSWKAECLPYRRNPLSGIDNNVVGCDQSGVGMNQVTINNALYQRTTGENSNNGEVAQETDDRGIGDRGTKEQLLEEANEGLQAMKVLRRSRPSRRSRDLDNDPETISSNNPSYTALLLEDIHNFHQKNGPTPAISLPPCVSKACSILEAVADLNYGTSAKLASGVPENRIGKPPTENFDKIEKSTLGTNPAMSNEFMEPSFHSYVNVLRGAPDEGGYMEGQESAGSNSFVGGQQHWLSSSSWEPNSADSTDCSTSSRTYSRERDSSPLGFQRDAFSETGYNMDKQTNRMCETKCILQKQQNGIGRGRVGSTGHYLLPTSAAAST